MKWGDEKFRPAQWHVVEDEYPWSSTQNPKDKCNDETKAGKQTEWFRRVATAILEGEFNTNPFQFHFGTCLQFSLYLHGFNSE